MKIDMLISILVIGVICTFYTAIVSMAELQMQKFCQSDSIQYAPTPFIFDATLLHTCELNLYRMYPNLNYADRCHKFVSHIWEIREMPPDLM